MTDPPPFDPPRLIQRALGGGEFFFEIGARAIHRVGLVLGLAWRLPFGEAARGIDFVRVTTTPTPGRPELLFLMEFGRCKQFDGDGCAEPEVEWIEAHHGVPLNDLRQFYELATGGKGDDPRSD